MTATKDELRAAYLDACTATRILPNEKPEVLFEGWFAFWQAINTTQVESAPAPAPVATSAYDRQRDIDTEGQRAALYYDKLEESQKPKPRIMPGEMPRDIMARELSPYLKGRKPK